MQHLSTATDTRSVCDRQVSCILQCHCSLVVCCPDVDDTLYNAALNRPVFASSELLNFLGKYNFYAYLANDGSIETDIYHGGEGQCFHSADYDHPWWAVDLGRPMAVVRADFTNRGDCCGMNCPPVSQLSLSFLSNCREGSHHNVVYRMYLLSTFRVRLGLFQPLISARPQRAKQGCRPYTWSRISQAADCQLRISQLAYRLL